MPPDQQRGDEQDDQRPGIDAIEKLPVDGRHECGRDGRQRRIARQEGHGQPGGQHGQTVQRVERQQHPAGRGHALAALETVKHRVQVADEGGQTHQHDDHVGQPQRRGQPARQQHRQHALADITQQREQRRLLVAGAQHIGGTRVARAVGVRIGQPHELADHHAERHRADEIGRQQHKDLDGQGSRSHGESSEWNEGIHHART